jgi:hypothetical protein
VSFNADKGVVNSIIDFNALNDWFRTLDAAWLFLMILALVVVVVGFWSRSLRSDRSSDADQDRL